MGKVAMLPLEVFARVVANRGRRNCRDAPVRNSGGSRTQGAPARGRPQPCPLYRASVHRSQEVLDASTMSCAASENRT